MSEDSTTPDATSGDVAPDAQPALRVVKGDPTPEELAALVAVFQTKRAAVAAAAAGQTKPVRSAWGNPSRTIRQAPPVGRDQWRRSAWA